MLSEIDRAKELIKDQLQARMLAVLREDFAKTFDEYRKIRDLLEDIINYMDAF